MQLMRVSILALLLGCGQGPGAGVNHDDGDPEKAPEPVSVVEIASVDRGEVSDLLVTSAVVESEAQADLYPEATGVVVSIHRDEGDPVQAGDLLAVIDNASLDAGAQRSRDDLERLVGEYARLEGLYRKGAVSERELTETRYQLESARTSAREASRSHGRTRLTAPFDGVVAARDVRVGELASSGRRAFQVVDLERLRVVAALPERDIARVQVGQTARLVSAYDEDMWTPGVVIRVAPVVDATSGTFRVTVALESNQSSLRPGQYVSVELEVDRHQEVVVIPRKALIYEDGTPIVYRMIPKPEEDEEDEDASKEEVAFHFSWPWARAAADTDEEEEELKSDWIAERVVVGVGLVDALSVEVLEGVQPGDNVVVVGQSNLKDGAAVLTPALKAESEARKAAAEAAAGSEEGGPEGEG
ncbi:MAG: efflux RND transporter periplasmic adaptor subunit [Deltaproteobacteria bacterium]|nr:efflux RND transporter periplasmic adaptor subunit [Deltaproteobacteria bacterium]